MRRKKSGLETLNQAQAAHYVGLSRATFETVVPTIPHRRVGARVIVRRGALDRWLGERDRTVDARDDLARHGVAARPTVRESTPSRRRGAGPMLRQSRAAIRGRR